MKPSPASTPMELLSESIRITDLLRKQLNKICVDLVEEVYKTKDVTSRSVLMRAVIGELYRTWESHLNMHTIRCYTDEVWDEIDKAFAKASKRTKGGIKIEPLFDKDPKHPRIRAYELSGATESKRKPIHGKKMRTLRQTLYGD